MGDWKIVVSGSVKDLETDYGFRVQSSLGAGMPSISNISSDYGLLDGALFQRQRADIRTFTLVGTLKGTSVSNLHGKRRALIDAIKPDRSASQQPVVLQYTGSGSTLQASCFYDGGLELGQTMARLEPDIALRFVQFNPLWTLDSSCVSNIPNFSNTYFTGVMVQSGYDKWRSLGPSNASFNGDVFDIEQYKTDYYITGCFNNIGGSTYKGIVRLSGSTYSAVDGGLDNTYSSGSPIGRKLLVANDKLYVFGKFNVAGSITACCITAFNGTTWENVGTGGCGIIVGATNNTVMDVVQGPDNKLYISGHFDAVNGTTACAIARLNNNAWESVGSGINTTTFIAGNFPYIRRMVFGLDNKLYVVGAFDKFSASTVTACYMAVWSGSVWNSVPTNACGVSGRMYHAEMLPSGEIYFSGSAITTGIITGPQAVLKYNGTQLTNPFSSTTGSLTGFIEAVDYYNNSMYIAGQITGIGDNVLTGISGNFNWARYKNNTWMYPTHLTNNSTQSTKNTKIINGSLLWLSTVQINGNRPQTMSSTTVTNSGTAKTYPILSASGPGTLVCLNNATTNQSIEFDVQVASGEVITLDLTPGKKTFESSYHGNIISKILPGSDLVDFHLTPGANNITFFFPITASPTTGASRNSTLTFTPRFWSIDGNA